MAERLEPCSQADRRDAGLPSFAELDAERRRIEGALHDGVQQDLAATAVSIQLALQLLETDPAAARTLLHELEAEVEAALERVRALAQSIYPSGLVASLGRYPVEVAEAVHFACRALAGEARIWEEGGELRFEVTGDFDADAVEQARARVAAVGGQLTVSTGGVTAAVPLSSVAR